MSYCDLWKLRKIALKSLKITYEEVHIWQNLLKDETLSRLSFRQIALQEGTSHVKVFTEIHYRTSSTLFCDNFVKLTVIFVILLYKTVVCQKLIRQ